MPAVVLPDAPVQRLLNGDPKTQAAAIIDWMQRAKGVAYSATLQPAAASTSFITGGKAVVTADGLQAWGQGTYTTNGSGLVSIAHGLTGAPTVAVAITIGQALPYAIAIQSIDATNLNVKVIDLTSFGSAGTVNSTAVGIMWLARI